MNRKEVFLIQNKMQGNVLPDREALARLESGVALWGKGRDSNRKCLTSGRKGQTVACAQKTLPIRGSSGHVSFVIPTVLFC